MFLLPSVLGDYLQHRFAKTPLDGHDLNKGIVLSFKDRLNGIPIPATITLLPCATCDEIPSNYFDIVTDPGCFPWTI